MPTLLGVTTKALRALRVGESIIVETVNQTRTQRAAGAAALRLGIHVSCQNMALVDPHGCTAQPVVKITRVTG